MTLNALVCSLLDNLDDINLGNLLKIAKWFNIKETDKNDFDVADLFLEVAVECRDRTLMCDDNIYYAEIMNDALTAMRYLVNNPSANKLQVLDNFLFTIKERTL